MPQSLTNLLVHIVFSTKNREPFLRDTTLQEALHAYLGGIIGEQGGQPLTIGGVADHVHIFCAMPKTVSMADFVRDLKRASSLWIKEHPQAVENFTWQTGYGAFSVGQTEKAVVQNYIANQEAHHRTQTFQDEYRAFLQKYGIAYDERYVWD